MSKKLDNINEVMILHQENRLQYAGGGYFREKLPKGQSAKIIHAPELVDLLLKELSHTIDLVFDLSIENKRLKGEDPIHE